MDIVREWQAKDDRVKLFINEQNLGDYPNRNQAAAHATGKYLKYVDADDLIYPWGLQILWECMERFPEAGWGLCSLAQDKARPFPFVLGNREKPIVTTTSAQDCFTKLRSRRSSKRNCSTRWAGLSPDGWLGIMTCGIRLALKSPVALMPHGVVWYRAHDDQESNVIGEFEEVYRK